MLRHGLLRLGLAFTGFAVTAFSLVGCVPADPPTVSSTDPANGETGTPLNTMISATFSEEMNPATITSQTFTLTTGATSVSGAVSYSGVTAIFNPSADLLPDTRYTATIGTEASTKSMDARHNLDDGDGGWFALLLLGILASGQGGDQSLAGDYNWSFTTGPGVDVLAPTVTSTSPADGSPGAVIGGNLSATFSESMDPATMNVVTFTLQSAQGPVLGSVAYSGVTATFNPTAALAPNTLYTATITTGAQDLADNSLAADFVWTFTTGAIPDTTAPEVTATDPEDGAIDVPFDTLISATFSEAMDPLTISTASFTLTDGTTPVAGSVTYTGLTATFTPATELAPETLYTATISTTAADLAGNTLAEAFVWTFTIEVAPDTEAPTVISTIPEDVATAVAVNSNLSATFSEAMDPTTISATSFTLSLGIVPILGTVTYADDTATYNPTINLLPDSLYTATISTESTDAAGNALAEDFVWTFTTGAAGEGTAPVVSSTVPSDGAEDVATNTNLSATFSEAMNPFTVNPATFTLRQGTTAVLGTVDYAGVTAVFTPVADLAVNEVYTATITMEAEDEAGNGLAEDYTWIFTTGDAPDLTAPTVNSTDPGDGAQAVSANKDLAVNFSEAMDPPTISDETFTLADGATPVAGTVTYVGVIAIFSPAAELEADTEYTATITTGAEDLAGTALAEDYVWTFTTGDAPDITAPVVSSTDPENGEIFTPVNISLAANFSEAMAPLTITPGSFTLRQDTTPVLGTVTYSGVTAVFNPVADLAPNTAYTATITTEATDLAGNPLDADFEWSFTTGDAADITAPTITFTDPADGATDVALNKNLSATFNEAMDPLTITTGTFVLDDETGPIVGTVTYVGVIAVFNPAIDLEPNTLYTATITAGAEDLGGTAMATDYVWSFTTGDTPDITAPMVSFVDPINGAIGVPIDSRLSITFSEAMDPLSITPAAIDLRQGTTPVLGTVTYSGVTAVFTPVANLEGDTIYTAVVRMEVTDLAGNPLAEDFEWSFTTGITADDVAPVIISTNPEDSSTGVPVNTSLTATFSEAMNPETIDVLTFTLSDGVAPVLGAVSYGGAIAIFTPAAPLVSDTLYTATITSEAEDLVGNPLAVDFVWTFTTGADLDIVAPLVLSNDPVDGALGVPINKTVSVEFSEAMDQFTITTESFIVSDGVDQVVGTVEYADGVATFAPIANLAPDTEYTATILMTASDLAGNTLVEDFTWVFTTGVTTAQQTLDFGTANAFAILAGSNVNNTGPSTITGDMGVSPGTAITGFPPGIITGSIFTGVGSAAGQAKEDLTAAFNEAAGRSTGSVSLPGDLSGLTLFPGLYTNSTSVMLSVGNVTLDAQGDENAVFLFQMGSTLTTGSATQVVLSGGAKASNVYWQVGSSATLGTTSMFAGNILAETSITLNTGAILEGRALTRSAAVSLDSASITTPAP